MLSTASCFHLWPITAWGAVMSSGPGLHLLSSRAVYYCTHNFICFCSVFMSCVLDSPISSWNTSTIESGRRCCMQDYPGTWYRTLAKWAVLLLVLTSPNNISCVSCSPPYHHWQSVFIFLITTTPCRRFILSHITIFLAFTLNVYSSCPPPPPHNPCTPCIDSTLVTSVLSSLT